MKQTSPIPEQIKEVIKVEQFDFASIVKEILLGKKITKAEWHNNNIYGILQDNTLQLHKADNNVYQWILNEGDLSGKDWIVLTN